jgi:chloramphenicol O-acetyltransferase type A
MTVSENGKRTMPMSIHVHHGLMDGLHLGQFVISQKKS